MTAAVATRGCRGCGKSLPEPFLDLGCTPLANAYVPVEHADEPDTLYPLAVSYCPGCHLVQLTETVPPETLFTEYLYFSSYSDSFIAHARSMAAELSFRFDLGDDSRVLEVASNDGYLLQFFQTAGIPVLGVEPARNVAAEAARRGVPTWNEFFGPHLVERVRSDFGALDLLVGNNVVAHVPSVNEFLAAARACLKDDGIAVFEFPYVAELLSRTEFDTIYHEHVFYYSLAAFGGLAARAGLTLFDVSRQPVHGGSLRVFLQAGRRRLPTPALGALLGDEERNGLLEPARYSEFSGQVQVLKAELVDRLKSLKRSGASLAAYGAPAKGNTLLNTCGIGTRLLDFTVDRNPHKQGLLLPGSRIPILHPRELAKRRPDVTLILAWNIAREIVSQQRDYVEAGGRFMVPVPRPAEVAA
jgi:SAM-dependent methyltransferase